MEKVVKIERDYYLSDCCGAIATHPGYPDSDMCSKCYEHSEFQMEDKDNSDV